jgi:hypothetical protein
MTDKYVWQGVDAKLAVEVQTETMTQTQTLTRTRTQTNPRRMTVRLKYTAGGRTANMTPPG